LVDKINHQINFLYPIQDLLSQVESRMRLEAEDRNPNLTLALSHLISSGGKRIRPAVALLIGQMLEAEEKALVTLAAAIELLHTATLVHDDLIDGALFRRGNATINSQWTPAATVLTGDFIFSRAAVLAAETNSVKVMRLFSETLSIIVDGEINQLLNKKCSIDRVAYEDRIYAKTASLFETAAISAAILSPVEEQVINQMGLFGRNIGMAFQIIDDILDFTGETATVGKPVGSDLRQGIITLPVIIYSEMYPEDPVIEQLVNTNAYDLKLVDEILVKIQTSDAINRAQDEAARYMKLSQQLLVNYPDCEAKLALCELASYLISRRL
jgi:geranylgeranyl pyrophosphate synthase